MTPEVFILPTPVKNLDNMSKHLTKEELEARAFAQAAALPCRKLKKPKLITLDKAASQHWARILKDMKDLEILDVLDTDALAIYCAKLSRRDRLQLEYLALIQKDPAETDLNVIRSSIKLSEALQSAEREILAYASKLGLTPESRVRLAKRLADQEDADPDADLFA